MSDPQKSGCDPSSGQETKPSRREDSSDRRGACSGILGHLRRLQPRYLEEGFQIRGIFGSYARLDFDEHSDVDIAYQLDPSRFFARFPGLSAATRLRQIGEELARALGKRVDLVSMNPLNASLKDRLKEEMIDV